MAKATSAGPVAGELEINEDRPAGEAGGRTVVSVRNLVKHFSRGDVVIPAVDDVTLTVRAGEFVVLLGPSGCGKTTLLRSIAGLESPQAGEIEISGRRVFSAAQGVNVPPERRRLSMVFQSYALWPHMNVLQNVAFPLLGGRYRRHERDQARAHARETMELVGIGELADQYPAKLSGGQQQRVALARALVTDNNLVLFDEPLSNVDAKVRQKLRLELVSMQRTLGFAAIYVTHDQIEAMEMADTVAVMRNGHVAQLGPPQEIYERPDTRYVSSFIGSSNEMPGEVVELADDKSVVVETAVGPVSGHVGEHPVALGESVYAVWRPERGHLLTSNPEGVNCWKGALRTSIFLGSHTEHVVDAGSLTMRLWTPDPKSIAQMGDDVWVAVEPECVRVVPAG